MFARMVLPVLGGSAQVWNTCMLFFQLTLLVGYAYAHWLGTILKRRFQLPLHMVLGILASLVLPLSLTGSTSPSTSESPILWLFLLLAIRIGPPFLVLAAGTPLIQFWLATSSTDVKRDPYSLYAASNLGSLLALLLYPLLIDPICCLQTQSKIFTSLYLVYLAFLLIAKIHLARHSSCHLIINDRIQPMQKKTSPLRWLLLTAVPSSLMLGVTTHMTQEIPSIPLIWTFPLGLYLFSFVLSFSLNRLYPEYLLRAILPILIAVQTIVLYVPLHLAGFSLHLLAFGVSAIVLHGELYRLRPAPEKLTSFYLWIAFGGMLGGFFNAIIAPILFPFILEYPLAIIATAILAPRNEKVKIRKNDRLLDFIVPILLLIVTLAIMFTIPRTGDERDVISRVGILLVSAAIATYFRKRPWRFGLALTVVILGGFVAFRLPGNITMARSYYGTYRISRGAVPTSTLFFHGNTVHGGFNTGSYRKGPISYFYPASPIGRLLESKCNGKSRIAVVGLGVGALSWYKKEGQIMHFFEIDPLVGKLARDYFPFLKKSKNILITYGDGRKSLELDQNEPYDLIILDAFSSDAIPIHLITEEALKVYLSRLSKGGALLFNTSNRHVKLPQVLSALSKKLKLPAKCTSVIEVSPDELRDGLAPASWFIMSREKHDLQKWTEKDSRWQSTPSSGTVWTDNHSSLLHYLKW